VVRSKAKILHVWPGVASFICTALGYAVRDVILTREEINGLMAGLLVSETSPTGRTRLSAWLEQNAELIGTTYASELDRHFRFTLPARPSKHRLQN
jgi:NADH dehydrogenase